MNAQLPLMDLVTWTWSRNFLFQDSKKWILGTCALARWSHSTHSTWLNEFVVTFPRRPHLSQRQSPMAATPSRFDSIRFLFMGLFEISALCRSTMDHSTPQEQHSQCHCQHTDWYAEKSGYEFQKLTSSGYAQWGLPFILCHFQDCVKKNWDIVFSNKKSCNNNWRIFVFIDLSNK
jgi:hypothetical protein